MLLRGPVEFTLTTACVQIEDPRQALLSCAAIPKCSRVPLKLFKT